MQHGSGHAFLEQVHGLVRERAVAKEVVTEVDQPVQDLLADVDAAELG